MARQVPRAPRLRAERELSPGRQPTLSHLQSPAPRTPPSGLSPFVPLYPTDRPGCLQQLPGRRFALSRTQNLFSPKQLSSQKGGAVGPERQLSLAGSVTCANGGSVTPAFSDLHTGTSRSADRRSRILYEVGQAGVSIKGLRSRNPQRRMWRPHCLE